MFVITKEFSFSASHQLKGLPETHPCSRLHGHNYQVIVELAAAAVDAVGFVRDYRELDELKDFFASEFDHRHLNHCLGFNPTAEKIAEHLFVNFKLKFPEISAVTVKETEKTSATFRP